MPELITLVACEKILIDEQRNPTLVVVMERVEALIPEGQAIPANVMTPKEWAIFTVWKKEDGESIGHCKQIVDIIPPGDLHKITVQAEFEFADRMHKVTNRIVGIPVGVAGTCWVEVRLESSSGVTKPVSYPLEIIHKYIPLTSLPQQGVVNEASV